MRYISIFKGNIFLPPAVQNIIIIYLYLLCATKKEVLSGYGSVITSLPRCEHLGRLVMTEQYFVFSRIYHYLFIATVKVIVQLTN